MTTRTDITKEKAIVPMIVWKWFWAAYSMTLTVGSVMAVTVLDSHVDARGDSRYVLKSEYEAAERAKKEYSALKEAGMADHFDRLEKAVAVNRDESRAANAISNEKLDKVLTELRK